MDSKYLVGVNKFNEFIIYRKEREVYTQYLSTYVPRFDHLWSAIGIMLQVYNRKLKNIILTKCTPFIFLNKDQEVIMLIDEEKVEFISAFHRLIAFLINKNEARENVEDYITLLEILQIGTNLDSGEFIKLTNKINSALVAEQL